MLTATANPVFTNAQVQTVFAHYPAPLRKRLLALRNLIYSIAACTQGVFLAMQNQ